MNLRTTTADVRSLAATIRADLGIKARTKRTVQFVLQESLHSAEVGRLPYSVYVASYGIQWAMATGRLDGTLAIAIRDMDARLLTTLLAAVATACPTIGDVPYWLLRNRAAVLP